MPAPWSCGVSSGYVHRSVHRVFIHIYENEVGSEAHIDEMRDLMKIRCGSEV